MPPLINSALCVACGKCVEICPLDVIKLKNDSIVVMYPDECWHCRACVMDCPKGAIAMRYPLSHMLLHYDAPRACENRNETEGCQNGN